MKPPSCPFRARASQLFAKALRDLSPSRSQSRRCLDTDVVASRRRRRLRRRWAAARPRGRRGPRRRARGASRVGLTLRVARRTWGCTGAGPLGRRRRRTFRRRGGRRLCLCRVGRVVGRRVGLVQVQRRLGRRAVLLEDPAGGGLPGRGRLAGPEPEVPAAARRPSPQRASALQRAGGCP